jgi:hypothetical protein
LDREGRLRPKSDLSPLTKRSGTPPLSPIDKPTNDIPTNERATNDRATDKPTNEKATSTNKKANDVGVDEESMYSNTDSLVAPSDSSYDSDLAAYSDLAPSPECFNSWVSKTKNFQVIDMHNKIR